MEDKTLKQYAKEAKRRMKSGFWQNYKAEVEERKKKAVMEGIAVSKVVEYYTSNRSGKIKTDSKICDEETFYQKVKELLDRYGEVEDIIGRLIDEDAFNSMSYEKRQRYMLDLSTRYLAALERYKKECAISAIL